MDERAFREKIRSNMKLNEQMRTVLPQHNELLDTLNNLEAMAIVFFAIHLLVRLYVY